MNEETDEEICAALAIAMDLVPTHFYYFRTVPGDPTRLYTSKDAPDKRHSIEFFTDWNATGALIEWAVSTNLSVRVYPFRGAFLGEVDPIDSSTYYEAADCKTAQEALVRAIYAAIKARAESERK